MKHRSHSAPRALRGPALDQRQQRRPVRLLGRHGGEARVGLAFGIADGLEQHLEVLLRHRRDHHVAVAGAHRLVDLARPLGRELRRLHLVDQHAEHRVHQRDVDVLAEAALLALVEGELDRAEGVGGAHHVGDEDAVVGRPVAAALVLVVGQLVARRGMDHRRVGRRRGHRPGLAEAGDRGVDQPRVVARRGSRSRGRAASSRPGGSSRPRRRPAPPARVPGACRPRSAGRGRCSSCRSSSRRSRC